MRLSALGLALGAASLLGLPAVASAGTTADEVDCSVYAADDAAASTDAEHVPFALLGVDRAHALFARAGKEPGEGVRVAVLDSGVTRESGLLDVVDGPRFSLSDELVDHHGSTVAGLIAGDARPQGGPVGIAPGAEVVDVRVYDRGEPQDGEVGVETAGVVDGLRWVAGNARRLGIGVVNVSVALPHSRSLQDAVAAVVAEDVVVVAASGNRPQSETDPLFTTFGGGPQRGEDAARSVFPAGYPGVVAVNATAAGYLDDSGNPVDATGSVLLSSATDVAAPTYGAVSLAVNGSTCSLLQVATSWSAAEVSGVVALLRSWYDDENAAQVVARLTETADGTTGDPTRLTGAGVVQPFEALTRPLSPDRRGRVDRATTEASDIPRATAPDPRTDPLDPARQQAVWWGLLGGSLLVLALLLRPLLTRRVGASSR